MQGTMDMMRQTLEELRSQQSSQATFHADGLVRLLLWLLAHACMHAAAPVSQPVTQGPHLPCGSVALA